jgi:hypothetical protein
VLGSYRFSGDDISIERKGIGFSPGAKIRIQAKMIKRRKG